MKRDFYHGILLGLLRCKSNWLIRSNVESGDGFVDILIEPEDPDAGIIIELKNMPRHLPVWKMPVKSIGADPGETV